MTNTEIFNDIFSWSTIHLDISSVDNMTDSEVCESILDDLLVAQSLEIQLRWYDLFRFLPQPFGYNNLIGNRIRIDRVLNALVSDAVYPLITISANNIISIRPEREYQQQAMNIAGFWLEGYKIPDGVSTVRLTEKGEQMLEQMGVDNMAMSLMMDIMAKGNSSTRIN